ncbi:Kiwa anti-phage protein KwaB-like domain-containing protein [Lapidilactobacillus dextrinicus]|uniref:Kiwa anti-phage protein KwaB-like domain-containing protein n=1 Tax=Lapidilactobacillus dextrinicus TaxID=51664 RepID=UPI003F20CA55
MNIESIKDTITSLDGNAVDSVKISFVEKRKNGVTSYIPEISPSLRESIMELYCRVLSGQTFQYNQEPYNELGQVDDVLEIATLDVGNIKNVVESITSQENSCYDLSEINLDKINYYVVTFDVSDEDIYFFRRFNKQKKLRRGLRGYFTGNGFVQLESEVIGLDNDIDIIVYRDEALIINRYALQTVFDLSDYFLGKTDQAMRVIEGYNKINNFESFENDCKNDGTAIKRLTKIVNTPQLITGFFDNMTQLPGVIRDMHLSITLNADGKIEYSGTKEERTQILSCMADKYYITLLQGQLGEDKLK